MAKSVVIGRGAAPGLAILGKGLANARGVWVRAGSVMKVLIGKRFWGLVLAALLSQPVLALSSIAFHYGADAPLDELKAFDVAVVDPDHGFDPVAYRGADGARSGSELFAYVSVGEVQPSRAFAKDIPASWQLGTNTTWASILIDQRAAGWPTFFADRIVAPLWAKGWRGFFLDTMDSYQLGGPQADPVAQQRGIVSLIHTLRSRFPGIRLIANRGFELLPQIAGDLEGVAAESLFRGYAHDTRSYREVAEADRAWLGEQLRAVRDRWKLAAIAIDYVAPADRELARDTARRIRAAGFIPWVADGALSTLGISTVEVMPRHIAVMIDGREAPALHYRSAHRFAEMPLNYFGYVADYFDVSKPLPVLDRARYAGIVSWFGGQLAPELQARYRKWLLDQIAAGLRIAVFEAPGFAADAAFARATGLLRSPPPVGQLTLERRHEAIGFEIEPPMNRRRLVGVRIDDSVGEPWARLRDEQGHRYDAVAITRWGGFALGSYAVVEISTSLEASRWVVDPFRFLKAALALPDLPMPETSSDAGRRMLFAHVDGDGFPSRAEFAGSPYAAQVMLDELVTRYPIPHALSVIEAEVAPDGLYPKESAALEAIARRGFALPNVEIATHTYSHPFKWRKVEAGDASTDDDADYHLEVPGYTPSLAREITASAEYIRKRLAPPGKPVGILLWSGDAVPSVAALDEAASAGLLNMNGGSTRVTAANPTMTEVSALGVRLAGRFQVYAPVMNENVYTNLWRGPFYGFRRVVETFRMTGEPRRIKPIDIYYHTYAASKPASLRSLREAYDWAMTQTTRPVFPSEFIRIATDFNRVALARDVTDGSYLLRGLGVLRSLRAPATLGEPNLAVSKGLAGWAEGPDGRYLILADSQAHITFGGGHNGPRLAGANGGVSALETTPASVRFALHGHGPLEFDLAGAEACRVSTARRTLTPRQVGTYQRFHLDDAAATIDLSCRAP
ncbi:MULTISPECIES: bifunctional glycoside hydrolase 114/ polysaccharide deacetylase family protein [Niveibacterium]|uniref:Bifunctional glycoside hydrolase 114/ polysaccharide deacetylase family protein n=1 Tax=Niveibacterium microcysteis TaxID=2811415 RepID=A0ABX7MB50_9RHOO|nr:MULTISPECIES: bifunctional glycoside hydrolase 114/ polysaccharide deacetylase family protein [Niveibacterium]QSI76712.1 bifunctional glycoside hydrolase 114/ polysaccharide deacetylase family protein [Niveibacterium microcysteis]